MRQGSNQLVFVILVVIAALAGCAGRGKVQSSTPMSSSKVQSATPMSSGGSIVTLEALSYKFTPDEIRVEKPGLLAIEVKNVSNSEHNFTLKDLRGKILKSVNLRPRASVIANVELAEPGVYRFYCDRTFHSTLGMKGQIVVGR